MADEKRESQREREKRQLLAVNVKPSMSYIYIYLYLYLYIYIVRELLSIIACGGAVGSPTRSIKKTSVNKLIKSVNNNKRRKTNEYAGSIYCKMWQSFQIITRRKPSSQ